jgi:hypothetical protein
MADMDKPGGIADQVNVPSVADPQPSLRAVALEPTLVDHLAQRRRVKQPA